MGPARLCLQLTGQYTSQCAFEIFAAGDGGEQGLLEECKGLLKGAFAGLNLSHICVQNADLWAHTPSPMVPAHAAFASGEHSEPLCHHVSFMTKDRPP